MSELEEFFKTMGRTQKAWEEFERLRAIEAASRKLADELEPYYEMDDAERAALDELRRALGNGGER